ncbi:Homocysteine S-methyltransferase [Pluteus cervinus]|uniref:Homocysteine S-methyltransferase n=1 Tax=Pluteus cervinus TaxID=181527 RepID=A0ACD3BB80_9AGAR|nr:Homocysteine S-methyltransferase [Pluteus cervinus]
MEAHAQFLDAGVKVLSTATYQCSFRTFKRAGYSEDEAKQIMRKSVRIALDAATQKQGQVDVQRPRHTPVSSQSAFDPESKVKPKSPVTSPRIALSLGPFGAMLSPAQEFDGFYPPPYGPKGYSGNEGASTEPEGVNVNSFLDVQIEDADHDDGGKEGRQLDPKHQRQLELETASIEALTQFHFERLMVFVDDVETWKAIDIIAFETVPLVREVKAIRRAMGMVHQVIRERAKRRKGIGEEVDRDADAGMEDLGWKPWWISLVFPNGKFPEFDLRQEEQGHVRIHLSVADIVHAAWNWVEEDKPIWGTPSTDRMNATTPIPNGLGINCTKLEEIPGIVKEIQRVGKWPIQDDENSVGESQRPWLVIYPNGGDSYDPISQNWIEDDSESKRGGSPEEWSRTLSKLGRDVLKDGFWGGVILGGCCRTGPSHIRELRKALDLDCAT